MAITYHTLSNTINNQGSSDYKEERWKDIQLLEGFKQYLYYDTASTTRLTIGYGFNVAVPAVRDKVMEAMGLNLQSSNPAEQTYASQIETLLINAATGGPSGPATSLQSQLDAIMLARFNDSAVTGPKETDFQFNNSNHARTVFDFIADTNFGETAYEVRVDNWLSGVPHSKERTVLFSLAYNIGSLTGQTSLRTAITNGDRAKAWVEIRYRTNGGINALYPHGLASRRYYESEQFGLYNKNVTDWDTEAKGIYQAITTYAPSSVTDIRKLILDYETAHVSQLSIKDPGNVSSLEASLSQAGSYLLQIYAPNINVNVLDIYVGDSNANTLTARKRNGYVIDSGDEQPVLILGGGGNDIIIGSTEDDGLHGGTGNDTLVGGKGNDYLAGGADNDTYKIYFDDGHDTIIDSEGVNKLFIEHQAGGRLQQVAGVLKAYSGGTAFQQMDTNGQPENGTVYIKQGNDLLITRLGGGTVTIKNFSSGSFGFTLQDNLAPPEVQLHSVAITPDSIIDLIYPNRWFGDDEPGEDEPNIAARHNGFLAAYFRQLREDAYNADPDLSSTYDFLNTSYEVSLGIVGTPEDFELSALDNAFGGYDSGFEGGALVDKLTGDENRNYFFSLSGNDHLFGLGGNDGLYGGAGSDYIEGGEGHDVIYGSYVIDLEGGSGYVDDDEFYISLTSQFTLTTSNIEYYQPHLFDVEGDRNILLGGAGNDMISGGEYTDYIDGGADNDYVLGGTGNDVVQGGAEADVIYGDSTHYFEYVVENGQFVAKREIAFANGLDDVGLYNDTLVGGGGNDLIVGELGDDAIFGGEGADVLFGDRVNDQSVFALEFAAHGESTLELAVSFHGNDTINGGKGNDVIYGNAGDDTIYGDDDNDTLYGDDNIIDVSSHGNDTIYGGNGNDKLYGGGGDDVLRGGDGDDILNGGAGNNILDGGAGNDTYISANAADQLLEAVDGGTDTIIASFDITLSEDSNFENLATTTAHTTLTGNSGSNILEGAGLQAVIYGMGGDDELIASGYKVDAYGGDGNDILRGGGSQTFLFGEAGNDTLLGGIGSDYMDGGDGNDNLYGGQDAGKSDTLKGGAGDDELYGESGSASFYAGSGDDLLYLGDGPLNSIRYESGSDIVKDIGGGTFVSLFYSEAETDSMIMNWDGSNLNFIFGEGDSLVFEGLDINKFFTDQPITYFDDLSFAELAYRLNTLPNVDIASTYTATNLGESIVGTDGNDYIIGSAGDDIIDALDGSDLLAGGAGDDVYVVSSESILDRDKIVEEFGDGLDLVKLDLNTNTAYHLDANIENLELLKYGNNAFGNGLNNHIYVTGINDAYFNETDRNHLEGGAGDDILEASTGEDTLIGGLGNDTLVSGGGRDFIEFSRGDGVDSITDESGGFWLTLRGVEPEDVSFSLQGNSLVIDLGLNDQIIVNNVEIEASDYIVKRITFAQIANTTTWVESTIIEEIATDIGDSTNSSPVANDDPATINEDQVKVFTVADLLANDSDVDGDVLSITGVSNASNGSVSFDSNAGEITFTPDADYHGPASFDYTLSDGSTTDTGSVNLTIDPVNDTPVGSDDVANTNEDTALVLTFAALLANDSDVDGDSLSITAVANASNGSVTIDTNAETITFTPTAGYNGPGSFEYTVSDGSLSSTATTNITVNATNDAPVAADDTGSTSEDVAKVFTVAELLANDTDADVGDTLSITGVGNAVNGAVSFDSNAGEITFTPDANYHGPASFGYTLSDGTTTDIGSVNLTIDAVNDAPVGSDDVANTNEDTVLILTFAELLANDSDVDGDGDGLSITAVANASNGSVSIDTNAETITFTPDADYHGAASFEYSLSDGTTTDTSTVNLTIDPVNDAPAGVDDSANGTEDTPLVLTFAELLANDNDVDGDTLTITNASNASNGSVSIDTVAETITFTPTQGYNGEASFDYTLSDGNAVTSASVAIDIAAANNNAAPSVGDDIFEGILGQDLEMSFADLLANDIDVDGDTLSITNVTTSGTGSLLVDYVGETLTYTPGAGEVSSDLQYMANDGFTGVSGAANLSFYTGDILTSGDDSYVGNGSTDNILGGDGNDTIKGKGGADHLNGNDGSDTILAGGGSDTLRGGLGNDILKGGNGNDHLFGNSGDDLLVGGKGNDIYYIDLGDGHDKINNASNNYLSETDIVKFDDRVESGDLWFTRKNNHLLIDVIGTDDQVKVNNWYKADKFQVDEIQVSGATLHLNDVDQLVNAMASFDVPDGVGAVIPEDTRQQLEPTLTAVWQNMT